MIREQQREVSKVLLDGLYDPDSPLSNLLGVRTEVVGEIIWQKMLVENWQIFSPSAMSPCWEEAYIGVFGSSLICSDHGGGGNQ